MLKIFFQNFERKLNVLAENSLDASLEQAIEIFETLPQNDGSYFGIISNFNQEVRFSKYNKFVWLIEIPNQKKKGIYQIFLTSHKCIKLINDLFSGYNPMKINGLIFERKNYF